MPIRRLVTVATAAAVVTLLGVPASAELAGRVGVGPIPVMTVAAFDEVIRPGCFDYRNIFYTVDWPVSSPSTTAFVTILKDGDWNGPSYTYTLPDNAGPSAGVASDVLCDTTNGPGTYLVLFRLESCGPPPTCSWTASATFRFRRASLTTVAGPKAALQGHVLTLSGRMDYLVGATWVPARTHLLVYFRHFSTSPWSPIGTVATTTVGTYTFPYRASTSGCYRTVFPGSEMVAPSNATICVPVV